jgi:hypothetical protein
MTKLYTGDVSSYPICWNFGSAGNIAGEAFWVSFNPGAARVATNSEASLVYYLPFADLTPAAHLFRLAPRSRTGWVINDLGGAPGSPMALARIRDATSLTYLLKPDNRTPTVESYQPLFVEKIDWNSIEQEGSFKNDFLDSSKREYKNILSLGLVALGMMVWGFTYGYGRLKFGRRAQQLGSLSSQEAGILSLAGTARRGGPDEPDEPEVASKLELSTVAEKCLHARLEALAQRMHETRTWATLNGVGGLAAVVFGAVLFFEVIGEPGKPVTVYELNNVEFGSRLPFFVKLLRSGAMMLSIDAVAWFLLRQYASLWREYRYYFTLHFRLANLLTYLRSDRVWQDWKNRVAPRPKEDDMMELHKQLLSHHLHLHEEGSSPGMDLNKLQDTLLETVKRVPLSPVGALGALGPIIKPNGGN